MLHFSLEGGFQAVTGDFHVSLLRTGRPELNYQILQKLDFTRWGFLIGKVFTIRTATGQNHPAVRNFYYPPTAMQTAV